MHMDVSSVTRSVCISNIHFKRACFVIHYGFAKNHIHHFVLLFGVASEQVCMCVCVYMSMHICSPVGIAVVHML